jgi:hypothetical protein
MSPIREHRSLILSTNEKVLACFDPSGLFWLRPIVCDHENAERIKKGMVAF